MSKIKKNLVNKILLKGALIPKLLNNPLASCSLRSLDFFTAT